MRNIAIILLLSATILPNFSWATPRLMLVGGAMKTCSSMSLSQCKIPLEQGKTSALYQLDNQAIERLNRFWPEHFDPALLKKIQHRLAQIKPQQFDKSALKAALGKSLLSALPDREYYFLLDVLETMVQKDGIRIKEQVQLQQSKNPFSIELYQQFVSAAKHLSGKATPTILVVTASARDPLEAVDFYLEVFAQAGANSQWLPIDAALQAAREANQCDKLDQFRLAIHGSALRERIYPDHHRLQVSACLNKERITQMIASADGIFFNGGDQSLTLKGFKEANGKDLAEMAMIRQKWQQGQLIIGGTSAGTAVQSKHQMITNGTSEAALVRPAVADKLPNAGCHKANACSSDVHNDSLTYNSNGGLGLFEWGILDTHFSERGRQGRLLMLIEQTPARYGFGVDETTALLVSGAGNLAQPQFKVIGASGVYIIEKKDKSYLSHYLTRDDSAHFEDNQLVIEFANWKQPLLVKQQQGNMPIDNLYHDNTYKLNAELLCRTTAKRFTGNSHWQGESVTTLVEKRQSSAQAVGAIQMGDTQWQYCSYRDYAVSTKR